MNTSACAAAMRRGQFELAKQYRDDALRTFQGIYGPMTETITRDTASHARATEQQTSQVLAAMMPAAVKALGKANINGNEMGFGRQLRNLSA